MEEFSVENRLDEIWREGRELGLLDSEIHHVLTSALEERRQNVNNSEFNKTTQKTFHLRRQNSERGGLHSLVLRVMRVGIKCSVCFMLSLMIISVVISVHNPTRKFVTRNIQDYIYPVMTRLRSVSLPILTRYPKLSRWYSEECLITNPFFDQVNGDCGVCENVRDYEVVFSVGNFTDVYYNDGRIVVITDAVKSVPFSQLIARVNVEKEEILGTWKMSTKHGYDFYQKEELTAENYPAKGMHIEWRVNRLDTVHVLRELFPRLYFIPQDTEISLHNFVFIDGPEQVPYVLPISEFANVVLIQSDGSSDFSLDPSPHCQNTCQSISLTLNASQVLYFNWIFWRPTRVGGTGVSTVIFSSFY